MLNETENQFSRSEIVLGPDSTAVLAGCTVAVFGLGGVGSYVVEALARSGIGTLVLVDSDTVCTSNINRQIYALHSTLGKQKVDVARERVLDINPVARVETHACFFGQETSGLFDFSRYSYVVDCIDTVSSKILLVELCRTHGVPLISSMGTGNKSDPTKFRITDIKKTSICPLARVMRKEISKRRLGPLKVLYSTEVPVRPKAQTGADGLPVRRVNPGSLPYMPSIAGLMLAGEIIKSLLK
jgi:tRNA A37 threonylcarbamoyladenosine dehydratase